MDLKPAICLALCLTTAQGAEPEWSPQQLRSDYDELCAQVASTYAYFDSRAVNWDRACEAWRPELGRARTRDQFVSVLEHLVDELYDPHAQLNTNTAKSWRLVPSGTDLWAEWRDGKAVITQVRAKSDAERAGIRAGAVVLSINGQPIAAAVNARLGRAYPPSNAEARDWALRSVLAGVHDAPRLLKLRIDGKTREIELPAPDQSFGAAEPVSHAEIRPGIGYILLNDSLGIDATVAAFDAALDALRSTRALIVDLRNTASGGNSSVARGILGRFVTKEMPYQKHVLPTEEKETGIRRGWLELVSPRGPRYERPVFVLVNRWTGSMGEGLAIGFDATGAGKVVGSKMAGLVGATYTITLPDTGIRANVPAERLQHVNGTPRELFRPEAYVDLEKADPAEDAILLRALEMAGVR